jgi:hypothetical protein
MKSRFIRWDAIELLNYSAGGGSLVYIRIMTIAWRDKNKNPRLNIRFRELKHLLSEYKSEFLLLLRTQFATFQGAKILSLLQAVLYISRWQKGNCLPGAKSTWSFWISGVLFFPWYFHVIVVIFCSQRYIGSIQWVTNTKRVHCIPEGTLHRGDYCLLYFLQI